MEINGYRPPLKAVRQIAEGDPCAYCYRPSQSIDHIIPRSKGGNENSLAAACFACNRQKRDHQLLEFLAMRARGELAWRPPYAMPAAQERSVAKRRAAVKAASRAVRTGQPFNPLREQLIRAGVIRPAGEARDA